MSEQIPVGAGRRRVKVIIMRNEGDVHPEFLEQERNFQPWFTRMGMARPIRGNEFIANSQVQAEITWSLTLPWDRMTKQITPDMRIAFDGRVLDITASIDVGYRHREIEIEAKEEVKAGV